MRFFSPELKAKEKTGVFNNDLNLRDRILKDLKVLDIRVVSAHVRILRTIKNLQIYPEMDRKPLWGLMCPSVLIFPSLESAAEL